MTSQLSGRESNEQPLFLLIEDKNNVNIQRLLFCSTRTAQMLNIREVRGEKLSGVAERLLTNPLVSMEQPHPAGANAENTA